MLLGATLAFVLLCNAGMNSQSEDEYATIAGLEYCGQSCPSSCEDAEAENAVCRCDSECERYGDCCSPQSGGLCCDGGEQGTQPLFQCRSIHLDNRTQPGRMEAFWMVSACPEDWPANQDDEVLREMDDKCRCGSDTLPPVTDLDSGVVYKNEYCAVCHQVTNIQPWRYRFGCSPCLKHKLATQSVNLTREIIEQECVACGFRVPQTGPPPRSCFHDSLVVDKCLARDVLEERTGLRWVEEVYSNIVLQCQTGPVRPVAANPCERPPTYRNQYCAICNAEKSADLVCANPYASREKTDFCLQKAAQRLCISITTKTDNSNDCEFAIESNPKPDTDGSAIPLEGARMRRNFGGDPEWQTSGSGVETEVKEMAPLDAQPGDYSFKIGISAVPTFTTCTPTPPFPFASFTLFFDMRVITSDIVSSNLTTSCKSQVFDPINQVCRQTICPEGFETHQTFCAEVKIIPLAGTYNSNNDSLIICDEGLIFLRESKFELLDNDTLLFRNDTFEIVGHNGSSPIICSNFSQNGSVPQYPKVSNYAHLSIFSVLSYVCYSLSVVGCVVVLLTYSLFKELRTLPGQILMNVVSSILATCVFLLVEIPIDVLAGKHTLCEARGILIHLLMLSQFSWMSIMSFELLRTFYRASRLQTVEDKSKKKQNFNPISLNWLGHSSFNYSHFSPCKLHH